MNQKTRWMAWSAWITMIGVIAIMAMSMPLRVFDADMLYVDYVMRDLLGGGLWRDWRLPPAQAYFPDLVIYAAGYLLMQGTAWHIWCITACESLLLVASLRWLAAQIAPDVSAHARIVVVLMTAMVSMVASFSAMMLYFDKTNWHVSSLLFSLLSLGLFLKFLGTRRVGIGLLIIAVVTMAVASDAIYVVSFLIPAAAALGLGLFASLLFPDLERHRSSLSACFGLMALGGIGAKIFSHLVTYNNSFDAARVPTSLAAARHSLHIFLAATAVAFKPDNALTFVFSLTVLGGLVYLLIRIGGSVWRWAPQWRDLTSRPDIRAHWKLYASLLFFSLVLPLNLAGDIISGGLVDPGGYRYLSFPLALILLLSLLLLDRERGRLARFVPNLARASFAGPLVIIFGITYILVKGPYSQPIQYWPSRHEPKGARCLTELQRQGVKIEAGLSQYWLARGVPELMEHPVPMLALDGAALPLFWMSTIGPVLRPEHYPRHYNFVMIPEPPTLPVEFTTETAADRFPAGYKDYRCPDSLLHVWLYEGETLDNFVRHSEDVFLFTNGITPHGRLAAEKLPGVIGHLEQGRRFASEPKDPAGVLSYGPYVNLKAGHYQVTLYYDALPAQGQSVGNWDIIGRAGSSSEVSTLFNESFDPARHVATAHIEIPPDGMNLVEFRTIFSGHGRLAIQSFEVEPGP